MKTKCITFDKQAQDALPEEIKAKMKADREKARRDRQVKGNGTVGTGLIDDNVQSVGIVADY